MDDQYEVLSPWAEVDPLPPQGINARPADLNGKRIGLYSNGKKAAEPMLAVVEEQLKGRLEGAAFSIFRRHGNIDVARTDQKSDFERWVKEQDVIVMAVAD